MSEGFSKWLERNTIKNLKMPFKGGEADVELDVVAVRALGEWAWRYADSRIPLADRDSIEQMCLSVTGGSIMDIAVACLGKKEVKHRLKEVEKQ